MNYFKMKITFFKNESHFYPRISYIWENAEQIKFKLKMPKMMKAISLLFAIPFLIYIILGFNQIRDNYLLFIGICLIHLPIHELCHAFYCLISGRKVERICFFPYRFSSLTGVGANVMPAFGAWNKWQLILLYSFPMILLTFIPAVVAVFMPSFRFWLIIIALLNFATSSYDIICIINFLKLPKNSIYFENFALIQKDESTPIIIHRLYITPGDKHVSHKQFTYQNKKLLQDDNVIETEATEQIKQSFIEQFRLNE